MGRFRRSAAPGEQDTQARKTLLRAVATLRQYQRQGAVSLPVTDILALLGAEPGTPPEPQTAPDPRADPITGCLPVTAETGRA